MAGELPGECALEINAEESRGNDDGHWRERAVDGFDGGNFLRECRFEVRLKSAAEKFAWRRRRNLVISRHGNENFAKVYHTAVEHHADFLVGGVHVCATTGADAPTTQ